MIAGCIVLLAVLGVCTYGFILKGSDTIFPNVYVAGVNVGGLKRDAAINAVTLAVEQETATDTLTVEAVRKCASGKKRAVTAIGYGNSIKCRPQQAAERKM